MIESLVNPEQAEKKPIDSFIAGFLFTIAACVLTLQIQPGSDGSGFLIVAFISIAAAPFLVRLFAIEEKKSKGNLIDRHYALIQVFTFFFVGVIFGSSLFFVLTQNSALFTDQIKDLCLKGVIEDEICVGRTILTGNAVSPFAGTGDAIAGLSFEIILLNNLKVLALAFVFSFLLGAGAIFLISWNATVIGVLIGKIAQNPIAFNSVQLGENNILLNYIVALPYTLLRLLPHGFFEFGAYFFGAIAGGILSVGIIKEKDPKHHFMPVFKDSLEYLIIAIILLVIGAAVEVFI